VFTDIPYDSSKIDLTSWERTAFYLQAPTALGPRSPASRWANDLPISQPLLPPVTRGEGFATVTNRNEDMSDTNKRRDLLVGIIANVIIWGVLIGGMVFFTDPIERPTDSGPAFGSDDYCAERAPKMREESPSLYYTNQEAYDACREAGEVVKELRGDIKRRK
jgi:hypothetical protein